ncbi:hypothetical protein PIB30_066766 [Stylosanthes scabra]|uniref:Uncharacterized protein n=1 Tax=Stylosanthes scabra TaxID=79078 RepID=A0ABU6YJY6_9FABA|nr:hypothetical protein [Stylosanthes scabra]
MPYETLPCDLKYTQKHTNLNVRDELLPPSAVVKVVSCRRGIITAFGVARTGTPRYSKMLTESDDDEGSNDKVNDDRKYENDLNKNDFD